MSIPLKEQTMCPLDHIASLKDSLSGVIAPEKIIDRPELLNEYSRDCSLVSAGYPWLAVFPGSLEEVQSLVRLAIQSKIPLIPVSSGHPHFHGDTVPEQGGIMVDFSHMKRIIKIDAVNRYAWLEPGVTFGELVPELKKQGLKLDAPLLPRYNKSVVTSRLEREPVLIPKYQYDYIDPLLTLEVVYGTGDYFRTGSASGPGSPDTLKADKVNPWGPGSVDYFRFLSGAQGTMGLVTWAITKVEVMPSLQKLYFVPLDDARVVTELMNRLLRKRVVDECLALNNANLAAILAESWPSDFINLRKNLPSWTVIVDIAGYRRRPEERVAIMERYLADICQDLGAEFQSALPGAEGKEKRIMELLSGPWTEEPYWKLRYKGSCHDIFFLSTLSKTPEFVNIMKKIVAGYRYPEEDLGGYIQPMVQGRGCHCEFNLFCDQSHPGEREEVGRLFRDASEALMKNGAFFSRPYGIWADMVYSQLGEEVSALRKLKGIFDPNNIFNPGKLCF
jgi:FAD/FMN-containing dehydrogenase